MAGPLLLVKISLGERLAHWSTSSDSVSNFAYYEIVYAGFALGLVVGQLV